MKLYNMRMPNMFLMLGFCVSLLIAPEARANPDSYQLSCVPSSSCNSGAVSLISTGGSVTFNIVNVANTPMTGTSYLAIAVPTGGAAPTVSGFSLEESQTFSSGSIFTVLNETCTNCTDYNLSTIQSATAQVIQGFSGSYTVYEFNVGAFSSTNGSPGLASNLTVTAPAGSVIVSFLENGTSVFEQTPLSESVTITPEPGSMALLGSGLMLAGGYLRRRWHG